MRTHGRYTIVKKIADGGMAEIFLATSSGAEGFERPVILKRILPAFSADPHFRNMLVDEAHIAMTLNHSNVVPVLDLGRAEGRYFLVLELVDGWDLSTILQRARKADFPFPPGLALHVTSEVCRGLAYAHSRRGPDGKPLGIVHRDISPQNVLISEQGEVKVTDFGIAKALGKRERTATGVIKGKLDFMSPEQASGAALDASSDIFSVGSMLYLLTTGKKPFDAPSDLEALLKVQKAEYTPPEKVNPALPPGVAGIINKAMQQRPSQRYRNAEDMMLAAEEVLRTDFRSAGQSDLKRWLTDLAKKDKAPPVSRLPGLAFEKDEADRPGQTLSLEDTSAVSAFDETRLRSSTPATPAPVPPPRQTPVTGVDPRLGPAGRKPRSRRRLLLGAALAVGGAALAARFVPSLARNQVTDGARSLVKKVGGEKADPGRRNTRGAVEKPERAPTPARPDDPPDPAEGPDERKTASEDPAGRDGERGPEPASNERRAPDRNQMKLTLVTRPPGASVVGPGGSMGKTPLTFTTRVGSRQSLTFAKEGFAPTTRRITASPRQPTVTVQLLPRKKARKRR